MKLTYNTISPKRGERRDRTQLFGAALGIVLGFMETLNIYSGFALIVPMAGFALAAVNVIFAKFYKRLKTRFGDKLEVILLQINGFMMLVTGFGFHISGSKHIQYVYYALSLVFFILLPYFVVPAAKRKLFLHFTDTEIVVHRLLFKEKKHRWRDIQTVLLNTEFIQLISVDGKKSRKYFLQNNAELGISNISEFLREIKAQKKFSFDIRVLHNR